MVACSRSDWLIAEWYFGIYATIIMVNKDFHFNKIFDYRKCCHFCCMALDTVNGLSLLLIGMDWITKNIAIR